MMDFINPLHRDFFLDEQNYLVKTLLIKIPIIGTDGLA